MKCANCPLYYSWNTENDRGESCGIFGDSWDNSLQYENKEGDIQGCYVDRHYIEKVDKLIMEHYEHEADYFFEHEADYFFEEDEDLFF
jgi:hypothetical protein